jgi:hypothetical protein
MNAPLQHPVIPAAEKRQETAREAPEAAPAVAYLDLDAMDQHKFQRVTQRSSFKAWRC